MGSVGNQNRWGPYVTYKDCSQEICSIYCPQWCYIIFPPPPPFGIDGSGTDFSPLIIAIIGILASAFILVSYYTLISKYCKRRNQVDNALELNGIHNQVTSEAFQSTTRGLDESIIKSISMCKYKKGDGLIQETDCSVCLSEFQEDESLRLLPKCNHAFHLPCVDTWLKSHATCPLCRANVFPINVSLPQASNSPPTQEAPQNIITTNVSTNDQYQTRVNEAVLVVHDLEEVVISLVQNMEDQIPPIRRSASCCSSSTNGCVSIADILKINEDDEDGDYQMIKDREKINVGVLSNFVRNPLAMKRSISTGRLMMPTSNER